MPEKARKRLGARERQAGQAFYPWLCAGLLLKF